MSIHGLRHLFSVPAALRAAALLSLLLLCCCVPVMYTPEPEITVNAQPYPQQYDYYLSAPEPDFHLRLANLLTKQFPQIHIRDSSLFLYSLVDQQHGRFMEVWKRYQEFQSSPVLSVNYLLYIDYYLGYNGSCDIYILAYPCSQEAGVSIRIIEMKTGNLVTELILKDESGEVIIGPLLMGVILIPEKQQGLLEAAAEEVGNTLTRLQPDGNINIVLF